MNCDEVAHNNRSAATTLLNCYRYYFGNTCKYNGEAQWWACNDISRGFFLDNCNIPCPPLYHPTDIDGGQFEHMELN